MALERAGKEVSLDLSKKLLKKYDTDKNGTLEFDEYQGMLKDWDAVTAEIESERARLEAALAAAATKPTGTRSRHGSRELNLDGLDLTGATGNRSRKTSKEGEGLPAPELTREEIAERLKSSKGGDALLGGGESRRAGNRRRSI